MNMDSALYIGKLRHRRFTPRAHEFSYPVFMSFLDIDRLPELMRVSPLTSYNRFNLAAYNELDHFGDPAQSLRARLTSDAAHQGIALPSNGQIFLLTHLRYLNYVFNPVSFFYCYDNAGALQTICAEVNNTFGESHNYWLTPQNEITNSNAHRYRTQKQMHVSPFHPMSLDYDWIFTTPGDQLVAHMNTLANGKPNFDATLQLQHRPWTSTQIHKTLAAYPFMTLRVIGGIHYQALKLWLKKVPVCTHVLKTSSSAQQLHPNTIAPTPITKSELLG